MRREELIDRILRFDAQQAVERDRQAVEIAALLNISLDEARILREQMSDFCKSYGQETSFPSIDYWSAVWFEAGHMMRDGKWDLEKWKLYIEWLRVYYLRCQAW